jgi:outer membrane protein assembly factor BamB
VPDTRTGGPTVGRGCCNYSSDELIHFGDFEGRLHTVSSGGVAMAVASVGDGSVPVAAQRQPSIDRDGSVLYSMFDGSVRAFHPCAIKNISTSGAGATQSLPEQLLKFVIPLPGSSSGSPAIGPNSTAYVGFGNATTDLGGIVAFCTGSGGGSGGAVGSCGDSAMAGEILWQTPFNSSGNVAATPVLFAGTGNGSDTDPGSGGPGVGMLVIFGSLDFSVTALHASNGSVAWTFLGENQMSAPPVLGPCSANNVTATCVFVGSRDGNLYAILAHNGTAIWHYPTSNDIISAVALALPPMVSTPTLFVGSKDRTLSALDATQSVPHPGVSATATAMWVRVALGGIYWNSLVTQRGHLVYADVGTAGTGGSVTAVDVRSGNVAWTVGTGSYSVTALALGGDGAVYASWRGVKCVFGWIVCLLFAFFCDCCRCH